MRVKGPVGGMSRRRFLGGTALALGGLALGGCSGTALGGNPRVHFWNLFGGGDGARLAQMQDQFAGRYPNIDLEATTLLWGSPYYTKLAMAATGGRPPEVAVLHLTRLPAYAPAGLLEPLDPGMLSDYDVGPENFLPTVLDSAKYEGEIFAIPLDTHPFVMYYNTDICKKAGLLDGDGNLKPFSGPDETIKVMKTAKEATGEYGLSFYPVDDAGCWRLFNTLYTQLGGEAVLSPDAKEVTMNMDLAEQAVDFMIELGDGTGVAPTDLDYPGAVAAFAGGQAGFFWNGEWEVTTFQDAGMPFSMVPFPNIFGSNAAHADRHSFVIPKGIARDPKRMDAAMSFVSSMLKSSFIWAEGGHIPAYLPIEESEKYKKLTPQSNYAGVADDVALDPPAWFSGSGSGLEIEASAAFQLAMGGSLSAKAAVSQFKAALEEFVKKPAPVPA
ncbi:extracellular solute-binding protein [soil metagenome]